MDLTKARFRASHFKATIDDVEYRWYGGFGAILQSRERGLKKNDVRAIGGIMFKVFRVETYSWGVLPEVSWNTVEDISMDEIREIRKKIFCDD